MSAVFQFSRRERASFNPARLKRKSLATQSKYPPPFALTSPFHPFVVVVLRSGAAFRLLCFCLRYSPTFLCYIPIYMIFLKKKKKLCSCKTQILFAKTVF